MPTLRARIGLAAVGDVLLTGLFVLVAELDVWVRGTVEGSRVANGLILAFVAPPLLWRRRWPSVAVVAIAAVVAVQAVVVGHPPSGFLYWPILIGGYSLGAHAPAGRRQLTALAVLMAAYLFLTLLWVSGSSGFSPTEIPWSFAPLIAWGAGRLIGRRRAHAEAVRSAERAQREQEQQRLAALEQERVRMARELHDILAHSVSLMGVQAGAAEEVLAHDPERARPVLQSIQRTARDSVGELRRLLGMLRASDLGPELAPQPGVHELDALLEQMRDASLPVRLHTEGTPHPLPPGVELTAYRVVQEALTNALKHARPTHVGVILEYGQSRIDICVENDGVDAAPNGSGHGLIGMRERVSLYGGTLEAAPDGSGRFLVHAAIPIESVA
jgi:signal transduction histidine kinase